MNLYSNISVFAGGLAAFIGLCSGCESIPPVQGRPEPTADCNGNDTPDALDIFYGTSQDCNGNGVPDECDIADGTSEDCNCNDVPDECDIKDGTSEDRDLNGVPDECDIAGGTSRDCDTKGIPDECEIGMGSVINCKACEGGLDDGLPCEHDSDCLRGGCTGRLEPCSEGPFFCTQDCDDDVDENGIPDDLARVVDVVRLAAEAVLARETR